MKRLQLLTICLMLSALGFGQNQSNGQFNQIPVSKLQVHNFPGQEIFRFQPRFSDTTDFTPPMDHQIHFFI